MKIENKMKSKFMYQTGRFKSKVFAVILLALVSHGLALAQVTAGSDLYQTIMKHDHLMFDVGFNTCDISQFETLVANDFEFYHDQHGITRTKAAFVAMMRDGLCQMKYKAQRKLQNSSVII